MEAAVGQIVFISNVLRRQTVMKVFLSSQRATVGIVKMCNFCVCVCVFGQGVLGNSEQDGKDLQSPRMRSLAPYCSLVHTRINLV